MSGIDTGRLGAKINPLPIQARSACRVESNRLLPVNGLQSQNDNRDNSLNLKGLQEAERPVPAIGPDPADLEGLRFIQTDWLLADLTRIELAISQALAVASPEVRPSLELGQTAIQEQLRRLLLVQQSRDSLVM
ncbi:MAG: hypothetical protein AAGA88_00985 [Pseudomonadota bacterium]